ncbi:MAG: DUF1538 domain-containing protein [Christensenellaceae bacterium]
MNKILLKKLKECFFSVVPITVIITILNFALPDRMSGVELFKFLFGAVLLFVGMVLYNLGSETALEPIGKLIGTSVTKKKSIPLILAVGFIIGFIVTIAEPDLIVLGEQLGSIKWTLILTIALGVGLFLVIALLRIIKKISLNIVLIVLYAVLFIIAIFVDNKFIPLSFDSGGVTTGPVTVPFILAIGVGVASVIGGKKGDQDSFGIVAICSIGPIVSVLILSLIFKPAIDSSITVAQADSIGDAIKCYVFSAPKFYKEVCIALLPILSFFLIMNATMIKLPFLRVRRILVGALYTFIGLSLFLLGANMGFMSAGLQLGERIASLQAKEILIPVGMIIGCVIVLAEPAVGVLANQVEEISNGKIKKSKMYLALCVSMAAALGLSMLRIVCNIPIWYFIIPGYVLALGLTFFTPKVYTAIAFDSGGVASGPMTTAFMLPLAIGAATVISGSESVLFNAYGLVSLVALTPLITIQIFGITTRKKVRKKAFVLPKNIVELFEGEIIELNADYQKETKK